ncbi:unnamed protein product [Nippostrongylus brasiliensis]|uniref:2-phosphosulfolactate phosphatase n=1 Tax=Nippostrongylus brasiliensis TaxID=27835 RepID=A0A0N4XUY9_NIPBR|nr:unnamed protein product [Nippostrongylus brasiliensis]
MRTRTTAVKDAITEELSINTAVNGILSTDLIAAVGKMARSAAVLSCVNTGPDVLKTVFFWRKKINVYVSGLRRCRQL